VGEHHRPVRRLVERVGGDRRARVLQRPAEVADGQRRPPGGPAGPPGQSLGLASGRLGPVGVGLVGHDRPAAEQVERLARGGQRQRRLVLQPRLGLGGQPLGLVEVDHHPLAGDEAPAPPVAGDGVHADHRA
jgi:hypothetical protein